jgi:hypothetical protein
MQIYAPAGLVGLVLYAFYGSLPKRFFKSLNKENMRKKVETVQKALVAPAKLLTTVPNIVGTKKLPIGPVIKMLTEKKLPIAQAVKALADKDLLIGQFPVGLLLKAASESHLPIATIQSILTTLLGKGLLKGAVPKAPLDRRLLKNSSASVHKAKPMVAAQEPTAKSSVTPKQPVNPSLNQKSAAKPAAAAEQTREQIGPSTTQSTTPQGRVSGAKPTANSKASASKAPSMSAKSQVSAEPSVSTGPSAKPNPASAKPPLVSQNSSTTQKSPPPQKGVTVNKTPVANAKTPTPTQKPTVGKKPAAAQKSISKPKPSAPLDSVPKKATPQKAPLKEMANPNPKLPAKSFPREPPMNQPKKLQPTSSTPARQPTARQDSSATPKKLEVKQGGNPKVPKLGPSKLAAKPNARTSAGLQTSLRTIPPTSQPLKKPNTSQI